MKQEQSSRKLNLKNSVFAKVDSLPSNRRSHQQKLKTETLSKLETQNRTLSKLKLSQNQRKLKTETLSKPPRLHAQYVHKKATTSCKKTIVPLNAATNNTIKFFNPKHSICMEYILGHSAKTMQSKTMRACTHTQGDDKTRNMKCKKEKTVGELGFPKERDD